MLNLKIKLINLVNSGLLDQKDLDRIYTDDDVVEELEKIKEEFEELKKEWDKYDDWRKKDGLFYAYKIIDNHIAELKGE